MSLTRRIFPVVLLLILAGAFTTIKADPPARIGRINYINGSVSFERGDLDEWTPATVNYPMLTGDHLWTDERSRAELHVGSSAIRLAERSELSFLNLDDQTVQLSLSEGTLNINLRSLEEDEIFEIDTPNT